MNHVLPLLCALAVLVGAVAVSTQAADQVSFTRLAPPPAAAASPPASGDAPA